MLTHELNRVSLLTGSSLVPSLRAFDAFRANSPNA
jgi:hypothetical protein